MEFKGTKGKWEISMLGNVQNEFGQFICESGVNRANEEENKANNLLISKAPELLDHIVIVSETIKNIFENYEDILPCEKHFINIVNKSERLIKEATTI